MENDQGYTPQEIEEIAKDLQEDPNLWSEGDGYETEEDLLTRYEAGEFDTSD